MAIDGERLAGLVEAVETTARRHIALGVAHTLKTVNTAGGLTASDFTEADAAEAEWIAANDALADYRATSF